MKAKQKLTKHKEKLNGTKIDLLPKSDFPFEKNDAL